jgi:transcriptional regulator with XRE-family HTH domain
MKLVDVHPDGWSVDTGKEVISLSKFCREARIKQRMSMHELGHKAGLIHPTVIHYENGRTKSIRAMLMALMTLGYEIELKGPKDG